MRRVSLQSNGGAVTPDAVRGDSEHVFSGPAAASSESKYWVHRLD